MEDIFERMGQPQTCTKYSLDSYSIKGIYPKYIKKPVNSIIWRKKTIKTDIKLNTSSKKIHRCQLSVWKTSIAFEIREIKFKTTL